MVTMLTKATSILLRSERPLLIAHPRPDGDAIGSTLALRLALLRLGKQPIVACVHPLSSNLAYLPGADAFVLDVPEDIDCDLVVAVDMSDLKRTGGIYRESWLGRIPLLVVDHHETNAQFGDVNLVDPHAAATAVLMVDIIRALGVPVTGDIATCLLVGLLTDTRGLRTDSTTPAVLRLVSELIEAGGDYLGAMRKTLDAVPFQTMRGWGTALSRLQLKGNVGWAVMPLAEKLTLGIADHDDLDLGDLLSRVAEAQITAAFIEMSDATVKVSLRSRQGYNVAGIAHAFGGGGHRQASGFTVDGPLYQAVARVLAAIQETMDQHDQRCADR
jgi:phosphoesterase RecJ-like protein